MSLPSVEEILQRTGSGIAVIVEGESEKDDPYFYGRWFGGHAKTFTFFAGGNWQGVINSVQKLRQEIPSLPVFGIIDRDYADDDEWEAFNAQFPQTHVLKMPKFTLENYLLNPEGWFRVFCLIFRNNPPSGWDSPKAIEQKIREAYKNCLPLAAHNWVIKFGNEHYKDRAEQTPERERKYLEHPDALKGLDPESKLRQWGEKIGSVEDFGNLYRERLNCLQEMTPDEWTKFVSGKFVLRILHRQFPRRPGRGQFDIDHYLDLYLDKYPQPPKDLDDILQKIRQMAGR